MIKSIQSIPVVIFAVVSLMTTSCVKKDDYDSDTPSTNVDPDLTVNIQIDSLLTLAVNGVNPTYIGDDLICAGIITADDKSGNFYKEMVFQDSTAGISILLDQSDYYTTYEIGQRVFIKLKGLYIADVDGNVKIGAIQNGALSRIPNTSLTTHLFPGKWGLEVNAKAREISQISAADINMLVEFDSVQFESGDIGKTYADAVTQTTVNRYLEDCGSGSIIIRTSGFANFASLPIPCKRGKVKGVVQYYGTTAQVFLRNADDVQMSQDRCGIITTPSASVNESFSTLPIGVSVSYNGWLSIAVTGDKSWVGKASSGNNYPEATAYQASGAVETWLVSPPFDLATADSLTFKSAQSFWIQDGLSVWFTQDFDVCNPSASVWTQLNCNLATGTSGSNTFVNSGVVSLSGFTGKGYIGFKYVGNGATGQTSNYRVDDILIY